MSALTDDVIKIAARVLQEWGNEATAEMKRLLKERTKRGNMKVSDLAQSIDWQGSEVTVNGASAEWNLNDYYVYIDLGVKGVQNKSRTYQSADNPAGFQFRYLGVSKKMVGALQRYVADYGIQVRTSQHQSRKAVKDLSFQKAYAMARAIKKKGITGTRFYSDVFDAKGFQKLNNRLADALGQDIEIKIIAEFKK